MKYLKPTLFVLAIFFSFMATGQKNDLQLLSLKGNVKSLTETTYRGMEESGQFIKRDKIVSPGSSSATTLTIFNDSGYCMMKKNFTTKGLLLDSTYYTYDEKNKLLFETYGGYIADYSGTLITKYMYDTKGKIYSKVTIQTTAPYGTVLYDSTTYFRLKNDTSTIEIINYNASGYPESKYHEKYDHKGKLILKTSFLYPNKSVVSNDTDRFYCLKDLEQKSDYDQKGNKIEEWTYTKSDTTSHSKIRYNNRGEIVESKYGYPQITSVAHYTYRYDSKGNIVEEKNFIGSEKAPSSYRLLEYDKLNNWIKQVDKGLEKIIITEREIVYY